MVGFFLSKRVFDAILDRIAYFALVVGILDAVVKHFRDFALRLLFQFFEVGVYVELGLGPVGQCAVGV